MLSQFFITRPKFAFVISILIVIAGVLSIKFLPVSEFPDIVPPMVQVTTSFPGADALTMEQTTLIPMEQQINGVENMLYMQSWCSDAGTTNTLISFEPGTNNDINTVNVLSRLNTAQPQLPTEVQAEGVTVMQKSSEILLVITFYSPDNTRDSIFLSNYAALNGLDEISRVPGVGQAVILGVQNYAMRIWLRPDRMASLQVNPSEVINAIQKQNKQVASGQVGGPPSVPDQSISFVLMTQSRLIKVAEFENIIIRENKDGGIIRLKDIGEITLGSQSYSSYGMLDNVPAAHLAVYQLPYANALKVASDIRKALSKLNRTLPSGVAVKIIYDTTEFVSASINEIVITLFIAIFLVVMIVFLFLQDWRATLVPAIAIPVSLIGTFAVMLAIGYGINTITMFGIVLSIGIVVDDAVVVIENVYRLMETEGLGPVEAARKTMMEVSGPVLATTMVLMAVFVPVAFIPGITGGIYRQFAVTIAVSVGISAINALTLSPALCVTLLKNGCSGHEKKGFFKLFNKGFSLLARFYDRIICILLKKLTWIVVSVVIMGGVIYAIYTSLPFGFIPSEDQGKIYIEARLPRGASLERTSEVVRKITEIVKGVKGVKNALEVVGYSRLNAIDDLIVGIVMVVLDDWKDRKTPELHIDALENTIREKLSEQLNSALFTVYQLPPINGLGFSGGFQFELQQNEGNNPAEFSEVLDNFIYEASRQPELADLATQYRANIPKTHLVIDKEKALKMEVSLENIFTTVQVYCGSLYVNQFNKFGKVYQVLIQAAPKFRKTLENVLNVYVLNSKNNLVPLNTFVKPKTILAPDIISHFNMLASAEIIGKASPGHSSGQAIRAMERVARETLPENISYSWSGIAYQEKLAGNLVIYIFILALIFIYLFLVAKYESWMLPFSVMLSVPVAMLGALIALYLAGIENNIYTQVGFVLLFGMASKTAILIVEFANEQHKTGKGIIESAKFAANIRFRAVIMTATAFIIGVFPLVIASGVGCVSRRTLGTTVFGGMIAAAIVGTILVPCFYTIIQKLIDLGKKHNKS